MIRTFVYRYDNVGFESGFNTRHVEVSLAQALYRLGYVPSVLVKPCRDCPDMYDIIVKDVVSGDEYTALYDRSGNCCACSESGLFGGPFRGITLDFGHKEIVLYNGKQCQECNRLDTILTNI